MLSAQATVLVSAVPDSLGSAVLAVNTASILALAGAGDADGALDFSAVSDLIFDVIDSPKVLIADSAAEMILAGAAISDSAFDIASVVISTLTGGATASSSVNSVSASVLTGVGTTAVDTLLLNHFNGSDASTSTPDEIPGITWSGDGELDTAQKQFGVSSLRFPPGSTQQRTGGNFTSPHTGAWTAEIFHRTATNPPALDGLAFDLRDSSNNTVCRVDFAAADDQITWILYDSGFVAIVNSTDAATINTATFYHAAVVCDPLAGTYALYFNGNRIRLVSDSTDAHSFVKLVLVGTGGGSSPEYHFDEARVTANVIYSGATYTIPTAEFSV